MTASERDIAMDEILDRYPPPLTVEQLNNLFKEIGKIKYPEGCDCAKT